MKSMKKTIFRNLPAAPRKNTPSRAPEMEDAMLEYVSREIVGRAQARLDEANELPA